MQCKGPFAKMKLQDYDNPQYAKVWSHEVIVHTVFNSLAFVQSYMCSKVY